MAFLVLALLHASPVSAQRRVEVYNVQHRVAAELLPAAQVVMEGRGTATLDTGSNSLLLVGDGTAVAEALALLERQDRRLRTIVIHYDTKRTSDLAQLGLEVLWSAKLAGGGDLRIGNVRGRHPRGSGVDVSADEAVQHLTESLSGTMRVTEGARTRIETGTTVPFTTVGPQGPSTGFATPASGFEASARILGDGRVQVDLAPFAGRLGPSGVIHTTSASTSVVVRPGETVVVGGIGGSSEAARTRALSSSQSSNARDDTVLLLRADLE